MFFVKAQAIFALSQILAACLQTALVEHASSADNTLSAAGPGP